MKIILNGFLEIEGNEIYCEDLEVEIGEEVEELYIEDIEEYEEECACEECGAILVDMIEDYTDILCSCETKDEVSAVLLAMIEELV